MAYDLGTAHGTIEIDYTGARDIDRAAKDMDKVKKESGDTDKALKRLGATLKGLGKGVAFAGIGIGIANAGVAAANLGIQIAGVVPQLVSLLSLSSALPGLLVGGAAAAGVLKASLAGVGDAVKAAFETDPAKFEAALKKLSPAARTFAQSVRDASPALKQLQQGLQESFFQAGHFETAVARGVGALKGMQPQLSGLAGQLGGVARQFTYFATSSQSIEFAKAAIDRFRSAIATVSTSISPVLTGLRDVGTVGLPLMDRLAAAVSNTATRFGEWLSAIAADGRLEQWINTALQTLRDLGAIAKNVGGILQSVFQAAGASGGGLLNTLKVITGEFNTFLKSAAGQQAMTALFTGIGAAAKALAPVFTTLAGALAGALGPALADLAKNVGPVLLQVVQALAPAFAPLAMAIASVASAIAPSLPAIAQLVGMLVTLGAGVLTTLAANLQPIITILGATLAGALTTLAPVLQQIVAAFPAFASAGLQLATALLPLVPAVIQLAAAFATALLPYLPQIMASVQQLIPPLVQLATLFAGQLAGALQAIIPYIPMIVAGMVNLQSTILTMVAVGIRLITFIVQVGQAFTQLPAKVSAGIAAFKSAVISGFNAVVNFARQFPYRVGQAIGILLSIMINTARNAWNGLRNAFTTGVAAATNLARTLPGRIRGAIAALPGQLASLASQAWARLRAAFSSGVGNAQGVARTLPGRIRSAIGNLGGLLVSAGADAIRGLVNGLRGGIGAAVSAAADVGRSVISGIESTLKIGSPSREMIKIGRFVTQGLVIGLTGTAKQVQAASNKLANYVLDAFSNKKISKKQKNSVLSILKNQTDDLLRLIKKSVTVAAKLKSAQTALTEAKKAYDEQYTNAVKQTKESFQLVTSGQEFVNLDLTKDRFREAVQQAKDFAEDIKTLTKRGLSKDLIAQLVNAGAADAGAMADALANSGTSTLKEFNRLQGQLNTAAGTVGKTAADALYGAGLKAAQGLVKGLQNSQKAIEAQMLKIAKSMEKAIKKALKIKSPSRVMFDLGQFTAEGLADGLVSLRRMVEQAAQRLATASILPTVRLTTNSTAQPSSVGSTAAAVVGGTVNNFNQTVNALPGMSAREVANYSFAKLRLGLSSGMSAAPTLAPASAGA